MQRATLVLWNLQQRWKILSLTYHTTFFPSFLSSETRVHMYCTKFPTLPGRFTLLKGNHGVGLFEWTNCSQVLCRLSGKLHHRTPVRAQPRGLSFSINWGRTGAGASRTDSRGRGKGVWEPDGEVGHAPSHCHSNRPDICASWPVLCGMAWLFW